MLRARASARQALGPRLLDGHETFPLQALEHRKRRRQWLTALAVMPTPVRDRRLDNGDQELGRRLSVTRFHRRAADPGEPFIQKSPEPSAPARSPTTDSIRAKLIPGDSDDFRHSYSRWLSPTPRGRPLRIQIKTATHARSLPQSSHLPRYPTPRAARCRAFQACHRWCASDASRGQDESNRTVHRRLSTRLRPRAVSHSAGSVGPEDLVTFGNFPAPVCLEMGEMLAKPPFGGCNEQIFGKQ